MNLDDIIFDLVRQRIAKGETVVYQTARPTYHDVYTHIGAVATQVRGADDLTQYGPILVVSYAKNLDQWCIEYRPYYYEWHASTNSPPIIYFDPRVVPYLKLDKWGDQWFLTEPML